MVEQARVRVAVVDDHRLLAQMLVAHLSERGYDALSTNVDDDRLVERLIELDPGLVILDSVFNDDEEGGLRVLAGLRCSSSPPRVVVLTGVTDRVRHAELLEAGAVAVIEKSDSFDGVLGQIDDVVIGRDPMGINRRAELKKLLCVDRDRRSARASILQDLTAQELATLQGLVDGQTVDEMALIRTVAPSTVRSHVRAVLRKLRAHSQIEAVAIAARSGLAASGDDGSDADRHES